MTQQDDRDERSDAEDPDRDPDMLQPRDVSDGDHTYEGDPDADPDNMNPRDPDD